MWVLSTCKSEWSYWHILHCVDVSTGMTMEPGCLFHFKQAIRRRMQKLHIPTNEIPVAMGRGVLNLLTILPHDQIDPQGIDHVTSRLKAELDQRNYDYSDDKWELFGSIFAVRGSNCSHQSSGTSVESAGSS
ncbi:hypothetical protein PC110_g577 [Phytophthora cactorum]|uniref:Uncharacterized protein n=3 Tax=Phytophthora cactorum TaxID=29920 RepID=A0A329T3X2_9STRA|nr:hypothetical protein PC110_g577 [Phytophthora cactorum]